MFFLQRRIAEDSVPVGIKVCYFIICLLLMILENFLVDM